MTSKPPHRTAALPGALACALWLIGCGGSGAASNEVSRVDVALEPAPGAVAVGSTVTMQTMPALRATASASAPPLDADAAAREALERLLQEAAEANSQGTTGSLNLGGPNAGVGVLSLGGGVSGGASVGSGSAPAVKGPISDVTVTGTAQGNVDGFDTVLQGMRAGFRRCHNRWLSQDPGAVGSITLRADLDAAGGVSAVTIARPNARLGDTVACAKGRLSSAQFTAPKQGKASITVAIDFAIRP